MSTHAMNKTNKKMKQISSKKIKSSYDNNNENGFKPMKPYAMNLKKMNQLKPQSNEFVCVCLCFLYAV